jgi:hypothetical protein
MVAEKRLQNLRWGQYINPKRCRHLPTILQDTKSQHHQRARNFDLTKYPQKFRASKLTIQELLLLGSLHCDEISARFTELVIIIVVLQLNET